MIAAILAHGGIEDAGASAHRAKMPVVFQAVPSRPVDVEAGIDLFFRRVEIDFCVGGQVICKALIFIGDIPQKGCLLGFAL